MSADEHSILALHRRLIALRRERATLRLGGYGALGWEENCLVFQRTFGDERLAVALNFGDKAQTTALIPPGAEVLLSTWLDRQGGLLDGSLRPNEGVVLAVPRRPGSG